MQASNQVQTEMLEALQAGIILPNTQSLVQWCKENVYLNNPPYSISGYFDAHKSPYLIEPLEALDNDKVREVVVCGNPRGGKTLLAESFLLYTLKVQPADVWWAVHKDESIKGVMDVRLLPLLESNRVRFTDDRFQKTQKFIKLPIGSLKLVGAQNASSMVQTAGRVLIGDELHGWADGVLEQFRKRSDDFPHSKKILLISQAGEEGKDFHRAYLGGHQAEYGFKCPHCEFVQKYVFSFRFNDGTYGGLNWLSNEETKPKGVWNIDKAAVTAHYKCTNPDCRKVFNDTATERRKLLECGVYIPTNPSAPDSIRSFKWNALATPNVAYAQLAREYLLADYDNDRGRHKEIKNFWTQRMSHFFSVGRLQDNAQATVGDIDPEETGSLGVRVMGVDSQFSGHHPYVVANFNIEKKEMQVLTYGKGISFDEIEKVQIDNRVKHQRVLCDCRYQQSDNVFVEIYKHKRKDLVTLPSGRKVQYSWIGTMGVGNRRDNSWYHGKDKRTGAEVLKPYSPTKYVPVKFGTAGQIKNWQCPQISFANDPLKDVVKLLLENKHPTWKLIISEAAKNDKDFMDQLNAEKKICKTDKNEFQKWVWQKGGGDNDFFDCLVLCVLRGMILGYL